VGAIPNCSVQFLDMPGGSEPVDGETYIWEGRPEELREGEFSLGEWLRTAGRLGEVEDVRPKGVG
jgi:hypothetical protein